jgi:AAA domain
MSVTPFAAEARRQQEKENKRAAAERKLDFIWADNIEPGIDMPGVIDGLLETVGVTVLYGESGSGKTFCVIDITGHVAANMPWRGMEVEQGVVVYVAAEGPKSVQRRVWAWKRHHGLEHLPLVVVRSPINLLNGDVAALLAMIKEIQKQHGRISMVVIDTLNRAMIGNENASDDMGAFVDACASIRDTIQTHVLIVHHSGKDLAKGARGHSSLRAATDVELEVTKAGATGSIRVSKSRDGIEGPVYHFSLEAIELGTNAKGRMVTTCVAIEVDDAGIPQRRRKLGKNEQIVFDALAAAIADGPEPTPAAPDIPFHAKGVSMQRWKVACERYFPEMETNRRNEAVGRAIKTLVSDQIVCHAGGFVWVA